jgi:hypothetical protein
MGDLVTLLHRYMPPVVGGRGGTALGAGGTHVPRRRGMDLLVDAFARTLGGWRPDPWPHGVQEEDRDRPWGRGPAAANARPEPTAPTLSRVQPTVRTG